MSSIIRQVRQSARSMHDITMTYDESHAVISEIDRLTTERDAALARAEEAEKRVEEARGEAANLKRVLWLALAGREIIVDDHRLANLDDFSVEQVPLDDNSGYILRRLQTLEEKT